jgi:8-amino-7-oxononanoate synthase
MNTLECFLDALDRQGLYPEFPTICSGVNEPVCTIGGKSYLLFCANNYLGLTGNESVKEAARKALEWYGLGPGGSRVISGNVDVIETLEAKIAALTGTESCLTFPTGYMANLGVFRAMLDPLMEGGPFRSDESVVFSDEYNHGSIVDGWKLSRARKVIFRHDDLEDLEQKIRENDRPNKLIVTEGVFSLEGEITDIPKYVALARKTGCKLMVDDAHGVGVLGRRGGGVGEHFQCADQIDILMGCMDKAFGGTGGYLCGRQSLIKYLRIACRSSILSSALPTVMAGAMIEAVDQIQQAEPQRAELIANACYLKQALASAGFSIYGASDLPVVTVHVGEESKGVQFARSLLEQGVYCPIIRWPAVPPGTSRFRIIVMASHTREQLDTLVEAFCRSRRTLGLTTEPFAEGPADPHIGSGKPVRVR